MQETDHTWRSHGRREAALQNDHPGIQQRDVHTIVRALLRRFKRVALILDRASTYRSKLARKAFGKNKNVEFIYLPKASPYLNVSEQCWNKGKRDLLNSEYYETFEDMRKRAIRP
ncbi:MAG: transposase [Nitrosopumilaceae archaeon]|nr:transposase [Nitrosopumilaceae archaeon]